MNALSELHATLDASRKSWSRRAMRPRTTFRFRICRSAFSVTGTTMRAGWSGRSAMGLAIVTLEPFRIARPVQAPQELAHHTVSSCDKRVGDP